MIKLKQLVSNIPNLTIRGNKDLEIGGLSSDSRQLPPHGLFIARQGDRHDGRSFISQAIDSGATAILSNSYDPFCSITQLIHPNPKYLEALLAARFFHFPSKQLYVCGITGTNGKTTTTYLAKQLLDSLAFPCGLLGTIEVITGQRTLPSSLTTQDVVINHQFLQEMVQSHYKAVVLEASSHGLDQGRLDEIEFDAGVFTNLTSDHLDYHGTIENYVQAKQKLFSLLAESSKPNLCAIANSDDLLTSELLQSWKGSRILFGFGPSANLQVSELQMSSSGMKFQVQWQEQKELFRTALVGRYNIYNILGAIGIALHRGFSLPSLAPSIAALRSAPGRLELAYASKNIRVFVDYAHTENGLENVLQTLREITKGRMIVIFGAGGGRDPSRRTGLAHAAEKYADISIVTSDNPRYEDPTEICRQILSGFSDMNKVRVELDRERAIELAASICQPNDVVLIAGKGHETRQIFAHQTIPFDDRTVAKRVFSAL